MTKPVTRRLGRTNRSITTLGLGGQASLQWTAPGIDPVAIIEKAHGLGINYMDTSNVYGPSQKNYGKAFGRLGLSPRSGSYDVAARQRLFIASKSHIRCAKKPKGERFRTDFSEGMTDGFNVVSTVDDVKRSLSLMFGDGRGGYPEGAYLDSLQFHNINTMDEVDMLYEGFEDPGPDRQWVGGLAAMLDLREGTNRTGLNPGKEKLIRHIGISGHWNTAALMYAIQRDTRRVIDTLLVTVNAGDCRFMPHQHNAVACADAADMGVIAMKVFADAAYYHKAAVFSTTPEDVYCQVGSENLSSMDLIQYALSVRGVSTAIIGIGHIDTDPDLCQLTQNLKAAQMTSPLDAQQMRQIEQDLVDAGKADANAYFQRPARGLTAPRNVGAEPDSAMPRMQHIAVRVSWDTAYAGAHPIDQYEVLRNRKVVGSVPHTPQTTLQPFVFEDVLAREDFGKTFQYVVRVSDASGQSVESAALPVTL